ncbi:scarecrow-like protein 14 [Malania oleifera]|uniref:scarecrow-like protein 14 n=1 Tax=Malania oleifera TaxID=397392 RepID=UPI0025AE5E47|nr:scarecrow-like protein 14 [Malania oleifera]
MVMDPQFNCPSNPTNGSELNHENIFPSSDENTFFSNEFEFQNGSDLNFMDFPSPPPEPAPVILAPPAYSPDDGDFSDVVKVIGHILMEEDMQDQSSMFFDSWALQAAERSFYEALGNKYPLSPNQPPLESPNTFSSDCSHSRGDGTINSVQTRLIGDRRELGPSVSQSSLQDVNPAFQSTSQLPLSSLSNSSHSFNGPVHSSVSMPLDPNPFTKNDTALQFRRGVEEASKFLPGANLLTIDLENQNLPPVDNAQEVEKDDTESLPNGSRGRKNHDREEICEEEERRNKQSAVHVEEAELVDMFDSVLLCSYGYQNYILCTADKDEQNGEAKALEQDGPAGRLNAGKGRAKRRGNKKEVVDLRTLLILCAQAVNADDRRTADELLRQIRQHSSPSGDGSQRCAHYFANALEARLTGTGTQLYTALASRLESASDMLKCYQLYLMASPFKKIALKFANHHIFGFAEKATTLHIIDFGILYGFQWPMLIHHLSSRPGGPPKLRITGIDLPQPGFRPAERIQETGHRLARYCERFNVPFEYNAIAKKWETIRIEDLKIKKNEVIAVNSLFRFRNLLDETVVIDSPRDAVLNLIRKINPDIFTVSVVNGCYSAPFFVTRFRELLFHFSAFFDMFDANLSRENQERMVFEKEFYGRETMNVIACEGLERVVRPETYKQWQVRIGRAGFRLLPLDGDLMKALRTKVKAGFHKDFVVDEDGHWMLQGWKGRILYASSCWIPANES